MTTPWWQQPMLPFDLETTGVDVRNDRVVTGYVGMLLPGESRWTVRTEARVLVNPGIPIPAAASDIHGIDDELAQARGCQPDDGLNSLAEAITRGLQAGFPVVGFNLPYDLTLLHWECRRHGVSTIDDRLGMQLAPAVDAHVLDKQVDPYRPGKRKLENTCAHWRVRLGEAHNCEQDALASARLAYRIASQFPDEVGNVPVNVLHDQQVLWRQQQATGLQRHFRKRNPEAMVDPCWPVCYGHTGGRP